MNKGEEILGRCKAEAKRINIRSVCVLTSSLMICKREQMVYID